MTSVMDQGVSHSPGGAPDVAGNVRPVGVFRDTRLPADVDVNITAMTVFNHPAV